MDYKISNIERYKIKWSEYHAVLRRADISANTKIILYSLHLRLMGKKFCFPSQKLISKDTGLTIDQIKTSMVQLKSLIKIEVKRKNPLNGRSMHGNVYDLSNFVEKAKVMESKTNNLHQK